MSGILYPSLFKKLVCQDNLFNAFGVCLCFSLHHHSFLFVGSHYLEGGKNGACNTVHTWARVLQVLFGTGLKGVLWEWPGRKGQWQEKQDTQNYLQRCGNGLLRRGLTVFKIRVQKVWICVTGRQKGKEVAGLWCCPHMSASSWARGCGSPCHLWHPDKE